MKSVTDTIKLANGVEMPCVGYGTWETPDDVSAELVKCALQTGYRHIDTANAYGNEVGVGAGIKASGVKIYRQDFNFDPLKTFESELEGVEKYRKEIYLLFLTRRNNNWLQNIQILRQ